MGELFWGAVSLCNSVFEGTRKRMEHLPRGKVNLCLETWRVLKSRISSFTLFLPFPNRGEVNLALGTAKRLRCQWALLLLGQVVDNML